MKDLAALRNAILQPCATNACSGDEGCWCDDCNAVRNGVDVFETPAVKRALGLAALRPFDKRCADFLADEVAVLVRSKVIDARSPAADALLDYRDPPASPRADRMAELECEVETKGAYIDRLLDRIRHAARGKCSRPGCDNRVNVQPPWCSVACMDEHVKSLPPSTPEKPWTCSTCGYMSTTCICTKCGAHQTRDVPGSDNPA